MVGWIVAHTMASGLVEYEAFNVGATDDHTIEGGEDATLDASVGATDDQTIASGVVDVAAESEGAI